MDQNTPEPTLTADEAQALFAEGFARFISTLKDGHTLLGRLTHLHTVELENLRGTLKNILAAMGSAPISTESGDLLTASALLGAKTTNAV